MRPRRIGICGTDYHIYQGKHPFLKYPIVMGHELAAEVCEAPPGSALTAGDIVIVNPYLSCGACAACRKDKPNACIRIAVLGVHRDGGMAGYLALPSANLIPADGLSLDECATIEFLAIGAHAVRRADIQPGERVLVIGAGPIGLGTMLFASLKGANVTALDRDAERLSAASELSRANVTIVAGPATASAVDEATKGEGFDVVLDATGNLSSIEDGFSYVGHGGRYVLVSVVTDSVTFRDSEFHKREMTLLGSRNATNIDFANVMKAVRTGSVPTERFITHRTSLAGALSDFPQWTDEKRGLIKAIVEVPGIRKLHAQPSINLRAT